MKKLGEYQTSAKYKMKRYKEIHKDNVYGPGDDNYGRNKPFWQKSPYNKKVVEMDNCVNCGKETIYPKNLNIDCRENYIEGAGQLCKECYTRIYTIKNV